MGSRESSLALGTSKAYASKSLFLGAIGGGAGLLCENLDLARRVGPNLYGGVGFSQQIKTRCFFLGGGVTDLIRTKGIGTQRRAKSPNTVDAHLGFSAVYILLANNYEEKGVSKRRA